MVDVLTHGDPYFQAYGDPHYIAPFGSLRKLGVWDYRIEVGQLWPIKPFEMFVLMVCAMLTPLAWVVHLAR